MYNTLIAGGGGPCRFLLCYTSKTFGGGLTERFFWQILGLTVNTGNGFS